MENSGFEGALPAGELANLIPLDELRNHARDCYKVRLFGKWLFIKALKADLEADGRYMEAFRKEREIGLQLDHPNLPKYVITPDLLPGRAYVAMEYIDGVSLGEFIEANRNYFSRADRVEKFIREISSALAYLHSHQILHLDLKPDNILITRVGQNAKIIDFGFSKTDSYTGSAGYTSGFESPERALSKEKTEAADYYGLGKLLEYIRLRTPAYPVKKIKRLEARLLDSDPLRRIRAKREIERVLPGKSWVPVLPLGLAVIAVIGIAAGFIFMRQGEERAEVPGNAVAVDEEAARIIEEAAEPVAEVANVSSRGEAPAVSAPAAPEPARPREKADQADVEALRQAVDAAIRVHMAPLSKDLREALDSEDFAYSTFQRLAQGVTETAPFIDGQPFLAQYPSFSEDAIFDIIALRTIELEKDLWKKSWSEYVRRFYAYQRDSVQ